MVGSEACDEHSENEGANGDFHDYLSFSNIFKLALGALDKFEYTDWIN